MSSEYFCLAAQTRLDSKWLKTDLQVGPALQYFANSMMPDDVI